MQERRLEDKEEAIGRQEGEVIVPKNCSSRQLIASWEHLVSRRLQVERCSPLLHRAPDSRSCPLHGTARPSELVGAGACASRCFLLLAAGLRLRFR